jgi:hypothetical protein
LVDLTLQTTNATIPFQLANFVDQRACLRVYIDQLDGFFNISKIIVFSKPIYTGYPQ